MAIWYKRQCLTVGFFLVSLHISAISILISSCVCVFSYSYSVCYFFCFDALRMACNASGNVLYVTLSSAPKSTPIPCTHTSVFHRSFLLCSSLFSMRTFQSLARSFTWFLFCVLLYIYFFFLLSLWSFFLLVQMLLLLLLVLLILLPSFVFFNSTRLSRYLSFYKFSPRIYTSCSMLILRCGKNSIRFLFPIFSHFVSFFFWYFASSFWFFSSAFHFSSFSSVIFFFTFSFVVFLCNVVDVFHSTVQNMCGWVFK